MIQKDYILRIIEQMGKMLAKVLLNKEQGNNEEAIKEIDNSFGTITGVDAHLIESLSHDSIAELFGISKDTAAGSMKCIITGKLLREKADLLKNIRPEESIEMLHRALYLYLKGLSNIGYTEIDMTGYKNDLKTIENDLNGLLSTEEQFLLLEFYRTSKE